MITWRITALWLLALVLGLPALSCGEDLAEIAVEFIEAAKQNPQDAQAQKKAGEAYLYLAREVGENPVRSVYGAMADFHLDQAVQLAPDDTEALQLLAETAVLNLDPDKAANVYEALVARQTDPADGRYLVPLHSCYQWLLDPWRAAAFYRGQLKRMPAWPQVRFLLATMLLDIDRGEAVTILRQLAQAPDTPPGLRRTVKAALEAES